MKRRPIYYDYSGAYDFLFLGSIENEGDFMFELLRDRRMLGKLEFLDAGCGTGWLALEISKKGFKVTGIDRSPALISESTKKRTCAWPPPVFWTGDVMELPDAYKFQCILAKGLFDDIATRQEQVAVLNRFYQMLTPPGLVVFDVVNRAGGSSKDLFQSEKSLSLKGGTFLYHAESIEQNEGRNLLVKETYRLERGSETTSAEYEFTIPCWEQKELEAVLLEAGFSKVDFFGNYNPETKMDIRQRLVAVAEKQS